MKCTCIYFDSRPFCLGSWMSRKCWSWSRRWRTCQSLPTPPTSGESADRSVVMWQSHDLFLSIQILSHEASFIYQTIAPHMNFIWYLCEFHIKKCECSLYVNLHIRLFLLCYKALYLQIALQYILEYPLGKHLNKHLEYYVTQLSYEMEMGRESALEMLATIFSSFPQVFL